MLAIDNRNFLSIVLDGVNLDFTSIDFHSLSINEGEMLSFPTATLKLADKSKFFDSLPIVDGSKLDIRCGKDISESNKKIYRFRVFNVKHVEKDHAIYYTISCILNAPRYINENYKGAIKASSSDVIKSVAQTCGLDSSVDSTADTQVWYGFAKTRLAFCNKCADASWLNNNSCFKLALTATGTLKLRNISALDYSSAKVCVQGAKNKMDYLEALDKKELSEAGINNFNYGYKLEGVEQGTDKVPTPITTVDLNVTSATLNINKTINEGLSGSQQIVFPATANAHPNYFKALYQNTRIHASYSNHLLILLNEESLIDSLDPIKYVLYENINGEVSLNTKFSGAYYISAKTILVKPNLYSEKLRISRQGYNLSLLTAQDKNLL